MLSTNKTRAKIDLYLISDSTGETVNNVAKSVMACFENFYIKEHHFTLVRKDWQLDQIFNIIQSPAIVMYTMTSSDHSFRIRSFCEERGVLAIDVLGGAVDKVSAYLNAKQNKQPGKQHEVNDSYFLKIEALNYTLHHDDGQNHQSLADADIIIVGVSRSSKSPTSIYLAYRGYKCANVPFVSVESLPKELSSLDGKLIIGFTIAPERLVDIRKQRVASLCGAELEDYTNLEKVSLEVEEAKRFFRQKNWPIIDVSKRSIEETAAKIIQLKEQGEEF
jgi:regulator of PEP synthase PpsR (kinase-PPPase family)